MEGYVIPPDQGVPLTMEGYVIPPDQGVPLTMDVILDIGSCDKASYSNGGDIIHIRAKI